MLSSALLLLLAARTASAGDLRSLPHAIFTRARRAANLSNVFGSATSAAPYDRIASQPVFQVSTPWGSPYMIFERLEASTESENDAEDEDQYANAGEEVKTRPLALYFMDEQDARNLQDEMRQMTHMSKSDIRLTTTSLAKALRQSANLGSGLPTGQPIDALTGKMKSMDDGGSLRYKIVPPKRELYYAARCVGRERVGLWGDSPEADAQDMLEDAAYVHSVNVNRLEEKTELEKKAKSKDGGAAGGPSGRKVETDPIRLANKHMEGKTGIPVFHCPGLRRQSPFIKRLVLGSRGRRTETPLFFSYEDMMDAYDAMRARSKDKSSIPAKPESVEVYNMFDVVSSMDADRWRVDRRETIRKKDAGLLGKIPIVNDFVKEKAKTTSGLEDVTFVPSSRSAAYKERVSTRGNGKARLRPMR